MNRLWILTPEIVLMGARKALASYDDTKRDYYKSPDGGNRFEYLKVVREVEYTEGVYSVNLHIRTIEDVPVEVENYRRTTYVRVKYDENTPRTDRGIFEDINIVEDVKCFKYEDTFPIEFMERSDYETFTKHINVPLKHYNELLYAPKGALKVYGEKVFLERNGVLRRESLSSFDERLYDEEEVLVEFINSVKEELGEALI